MGKELGRISGPLLSDNLLRNGKNLAFDNDVLFLDVNNKFVGFNTNTPVVAVDVFGDIASLEFTATHQADIAHLIFGGTGTSNQINNYFNEPIAIIPNQSATPTIQLPGIGSTNKFAFVGATLTGETNQDITFDPVGTGRLIVGTALSNTDIEVDGSIEATGNITFDGNVTLGNDTSDVITFGARVGSDLLPSTNSLYQLGENLTPSIWKNIFAANLNTTDFNTTNANITTLNSGNIRISGTDISNIVSTNDVNIVPNGTGNLNFNSLVSFKDNTFSHLSSVPLQFVSTGNGYFKFGGPTGWVVPTGTVAQRPVFPDVGTIRYNTDTVTPEVYADIASSTTLTDTITTADVNIGDTTIYVDNTVGFRVGDFVSSTTTPSAFATPTLIISITPGVSIDIDMSATAFAASGSNIRVQRKWIPMIGTSPVLSTTEVEEIMEIWSLILG
jgi:hypothetical protein